MKQELNYTAEKAKSILGKLSCDYAEIRLSSNTTTSVVLSGEQTESVSSGDSIAGSIRILNNGSWGFVAFNDLNSIESFIKKSIIISSEINAIEKSTVISLKPLRKAFYTEINKDFKKISIDQKFNLIKGYNTILNSSDFIQTTRSIYRDIHSNYIYLNSEGSEITYNKSFCGVSLSAIAKDGTIIQPFQNSIAGYGGFEIVENREETAEAVLKTAIDLLKAEKVIGGTYNLVIDPKLAGVFIHEAFGHLSEADFIYENKQMRDLMKIGNNFGPEDLNIIDNGNIPGLSGYIPFDDEGVLPSKTYLIRNGILDSRLHSRETAAKMDEKHTGNGRAMSVMRTPIVRMTNTYIDNGSFSKDEIIDSVKDGIYAIDFIGGQTNLEMFTFTSGYGYEIKNGKLGRMYKDIILSGNVFSTLKNILKIGCDKQMFGGLGGCGKDGQSPLPVSFGGPHIQIKNVLVG